MRHGEIDIDAKGQTSILGVFAAGDVITVPLMQIAIEIAANDVTVPARVMPLNYLSTQKDRDEAIHGSALIRKMIQAPAFKKLPSKKYHRLQQ